MNVSSGSEDDDPMREPRAYNRSIYFMVAMPYLLLGVIGFKVYRGYRAAQRQALNQLLQPNRDSQEPPTVGLDSAQGASP